MPPRLLALTLLLVLSFAPVVSAAPPPGAETVSAPKALERLKAGGRRFASGKTQGQDHLYRVRATAPGQAPFAAVLGCMDSRVPPEVVFDQGIGDLFSIRVAGNVVDEDVLGSLEYAAKVMNVKLIVVLGHTHCGAVKGACDGVELGNLTALLARIAPAVDKVPAGVTPRDSKNEAFVDKAARENVLLSIRNIREGSPVLAELEKTGGLQIAGAMYDVETGKTEFLE